MSVRTRPALLVLTAALVVLAPSAARADPPASDDRSPSCGVLLSSVDDWPGTGPAGVQLVSDAYERYLLSQPACVDPQG